MRALLLTLLMATTANAIGISYDPNTGGVTVFDIGDLDTFGFYYPTKYNASEGWMGDDIERDGLKRFSPGTHQPHSYLMTYVKYQRPLGFPNKLIIGNIMLPNITDDFENDYWDGSPMELPGECQMYHRPWSSIWEVVDIGVEYTAMTHVPEPGAMALLAILAIAALILIRRIR
jgi:hypothetical protein